MINREVWKSVVGYEGIYEISNFGNVRSLPRLIKRKGGDYFDKGCVLAKSKTTTGYWKVELSVSGKRRSCKVHRLVAAAFINNPDNKPMVNHMDGNPLNNHVDNLEWCTQSENMRHAYDNGLRKCGLIEHKDDILYYYEVDKSVSIKELADKYQCSQKSISGLLKERGIHIRPASIYKIDRTELIKDFIDGYTNKQLANKFKTNTSLIATYRYKHKKGELII